MSKLCELNEYLESTRMMSRTELNAIIKDLDSTAIEMQTQGFAHSVLGYMMSDKLDGLNPNFREAVTKAGSLKERHPWLFCEPVAQAIIGGDEVDELPVQKAVKAPKVKAEKKSDTAKRIFAGLTDKSKANVIKVFMQELNTSASGAQTFYYAAGGEKSGRRPKASKASGNVVIRSTSSTPKAPTKRQLAQAIFDSSTDKTREYLVNRFMKELSMTKMGATTYAYTVGCVKSRK